MALPRGVMGQLSRARAICFTLRKRKKNKTIKNKEAHHNHPGGCKQTIPKVFRNDYLPVRGGSCRAPSEINNSSAAASASVAGDVGKGKLTTCKKQNGQTHFSVKIL